MQTEIGTLFEVFHQNSLNFIDCWLITVDLFLGFGLIEVPSLTTFTRALELRGTLFDLLVDLAILIYIWTQEHKYFLQALTHFHQFPMENAALISITRSNELRHLQKVIFVQFSYGIMPISP